MMYAQEHFFDVTQIKKQNLNNKNRSSQRRFIQHNGSCYSNPLSQDSDRVHYKMLKLPSSKRGEKKQLPDSPNAVKIDSLKLDMIEQ